MTSPIESLAQARQLADTMAAARDNLVFGVEPNIKKYQVDHAHMLTIVPSQSYCEAIAGVFSSDPDYETRLTAIETAIAELHSALQNVLDKMEAVRALNPQLLPNPYAQTDPG